MEAKPGKPEMEIDFICNGEEPKEDKY